MRGCRCPTCVSILLQSGGPQPPEAKKIIVLGEAGPATSVSDPTVVVTGPRKVGSSSDIASGASTTSIHVIKRWWQKYSKPSRVVVRSESAFVSSPNSTLSSFSSANASVVSASSTSASAANALSAKIQTLRAFLRKAPSKDASSVANASSRANATPISDARDGLRPSRAKRE